MLDHHETADFLRRYDGVPPEILADGTWLLERRTFWAGLMYGAADEELLDALFGAGDEVWLTDLIDELWSEIEQTGTWPVVRFGTEAADFAMVAWHGHDTEGYDFVVLPGDGRCISVAGLEGGFHGPGLSWPEAQRLVDRGSRGSAAQRLLLLLRAVGDADRPTDAVGQVAEALRSVGHATCTSEIAMEVARQLLEGGPRWTMRGETLLCDGEHAVRRPGGLPPEDLLRVTQVLR